MKTVDGLTSLTPEKSIFGKVIGIVENRDLLRAVTKALLKLGAHDIQVLEGAVGTKRLESEQETVSNCFMGDMESEMVKRYLNAVNQGLIVFVATVDPETTDLAAESAKSNGASEVVHFGNWVITNY